jgi:hypothetical protein
MRARVKLTTHPADAEIEVGGQRIEGAVRALAIDASAGGMPLISLELAVPADIDVEGHARVSMPSPVRQALIALGWTPPPEG